MIVWLLANILMGAIVVNKLKKEDRNVVVMVRMVLSMLAGTLAGTLVGIGFVKWFGW